MTSDGDEVRAPAQGKWRDAFRHGTGGWLVVPLTSLLALLFDSVREHTTVIGAALAGVVVGSVATVGIFRERLWATLAAPERVRLVAAYGVAVLAAVVVATVGLATDAQPAPSPVVGLTTPPASTEPAPTQSTSGSGTPTVTTPPVTGRPAAPTAFIPPDKLGSVNFSEEEVADSTGHFTSDEQDTRGEEVFDPSGFTLCDGVEISAPAVVDSHPQRFRSSRSPAYFQSYFASEPTLYNSVEGAVKLLRDVRAGAEQCGFVVRPGVALGEETLRLSKRGENGGYQDHVFFRRRNVVVQVGSTSDDGDHTTQIEQLAGLCASVLRRLVPASDGPR